MKINTAKSAIMSFHRSRKSDYLPETYLDNNRLDLIESTKLLGVMISSDMKWKENTEFIKKHKLNGL